MKRVYEFEVIIPQSVFVYVSLDSITDFLSYSNVKFESKGFTDSKIEFLVTASSRQIASEVLNLFYAIKRFVLASAYSITDLHICESWIFGAIREVEYD